MKSLFAVSALALILLLGACPAAPPTFSQTKHDAGSTHGALDFAGVGAGSCGAAEPCCQGKTCETGLTCASNGVCCGTGGFGCQTGKECCAGLACPKDGLCCAGITSSCTKPSDCCTGLTCTSDGICDKPAAGGSDGDPCSVAAPCTAGFECSEAGKCALCGTNGHSCCATQTECNPGLSCTNHICKTACGATGQGCCAGNTCNAAGATCTAGKCVGTGAPGTLNNPCLSGMTCTGSLNCVGGTCMAAPTCNTVGVACCPGSPKTCTAGLQCAENGTCQTARVCTAIEGDCTSAASCCTGYQCLLTVQPVGVADKKTCCVNSGTSCPDGDLDCCGYLRCVNSKCAPNQDGDGCLQNSDCAKADCDTTSGLCGGAASVCGSLTPVGGTCATDSECCDGVCRELASTRDLTCCQGAYAPCTTNKDCCGVMVCGADKTCTPRTPGQTCIDSVECTTDHNCVNGKCATSSASGPGGACTTVSSCAQGGSGVDCEGGTCCSTEALTPCVNDSYCCASYGYSCNFVATFGKNVCCSTAGQFCGTSSDCCSLSCNINNRCD